MCVVYVAKFKIHYKKVCETYICEFPATIGLVFDQGKASKPSQAAGTREAHSRKHGCPWKAVAAFHTEVLCEELRVSSHASTTSEST